MSPECDTLCRNTFAIQKTATPILIIGTTQDPATSYAWTKALNNNIVGLRLITMKGDGHTGHGRGSAYKNDAVDAYLMNGVILTETSFAAGRGIESCI